MLIAVPLIGRLGGRMSRIADQHVFAQGFTRLGDPAGFPSTDMNSPRAQATGQLHAGGKVISCMTAHHQAEIGGHAQEGAAKRLEPLDAPRRLPQLDHGQPALGGGPDAVTHPLLSKPGGIGDNVERGK